MGAVGEVGYQPLGEAGIACGQGRAKFGSDAQCQGLCPPATRIEHRRRDVAWPSAASRNLGNTGRS
jgi:hypothetical protein